MKFFLYFFLIPFSLSACDVCTWMDEEIYKVEYHLLQECSIETEEDTRKACYIVGYRDALVRVKYLFQYHYGCLD